MSEHLVHNMVHSLLFIRTIYHTTTSHQTTS